MGGHHSNACIHSPDQQFGSPCTSTGFWILGKWFLAPKPSFAARTGRIWLWENDALDMLLPETPQELRAEISP